MSNKHYNHNCDNNLGIGRFGGSSFVEIVKIQGMIAEDLIAKGDTNLNRLDFC